MNDRRVKVRVVSLSPDEWLSGAAVLQADERGCYITICCLIYSHGGPIPDDPIDLARLCNVTKARWERIRSELIRRGKVIERAGFLTQSRCEKELDHASLRFQKALDHARLGGISSGKSRSLSKGYNGLGEPDASFQNEPILRKKEDSSLFKLEEDSQKVDTDSYRLRDSSTDRESKTLDQSANLKNGFDGAFEVWWQRCPRKIGKGQARAAYRSARKKVNAEVLITAIEKFAEQCAGKDQKFIPHPATWLNGERWADESSTPSDAGIIRYTGDYRGPGG